MKAESLCARWSAVPDRGEDDCAAAAGALCVADGCGGLGGKRYGRLGGVTGAYLAARLATAAFARLAEGVPFPDRRAEGAALQRRLQDGLHGALAAFYRERCADGESERIVGSLRRELPTTLCAALAREGAEGVDACFAWAGDSRGYALDAGGLRQLTRDDALGAPDALESLYRDVPLTNLLSADEPARLHLRRARLVSPCLVICATDGAFGCLSTPMEFEMLLLSTMNAADGMDNWKRKLQIAFGRVAHDDATLALTAYGYEDFARMRERFAPRRDELRRRYVEPVRERGAGLALAREKWNDYRLRYDWTEGADDETDWRI